MPVMTRCRSLSLLMLYLALYALFGAATVWFYPPYSYPYGDEGTYLSYAQRPWTMVSEFFEGYPPKEVMSPYNFRLFLWPFSLVFAVFGFTFVGARLVMLGCGLGVLYLAYRLGEKLGSRGGAWLAVLILSLSPSFLFFTHGIRPEGMMALFILLCLWLVLRRDEGPGISTYGWVGLTSASMLWIHYNGVVMPAVFFAALLVRDWGRVGWLKIAVFCGGVSVFAAGFLVINFLPALDTVRLFGVLPVTFVSSNQVPILHEANPWSVVCASVDGYLRFFREQSFLEPMTIHLTAGFCVLGMLALIFKPDRGRWCAATVVIAIITMMLFVFPNRRQEYVFYVLPILFLLAACGLAALPMRTVRYPLVVVVTAIMAGVYLWVTVGTLKDAWRRYPDNQRTGVVLRQVVDQLGGPGRVKVMGVQEFAPFVKSAAYRTFHSLFETRDFRQTLRLIRPDVVVLDRRGVSVIGLFLGTWRGDRTADENFHAVADAAIYVLQDQGYSLYETEVPRWNGQPVGIFRRPR